MVETYDENIGISCLQGDLNWDLKAKGKTFNASISITNARYINCGNILRAFITIFHMKVLKRSRLIADSQSNK